MKTTDPVADMLTRIRNGLSAHKPMAEMPASRLKLQIARILKEEGYIENFLVSEEGPQGTLRIVLKYIDEKEPLIHALVRLSKPGCRKYAGHAKMPRVLSGLGTAIVSTSKGVMTEAQARETGVGGELLCAVW